MAANVPKCNLKIIKYNPTFVLFLFRYMKIPLIFLFVDMNNDFNFWILFATFGYQKCR